MMCYLNKNSFKKIFFVKYFAFFTEGSSVYIIYLLSKHPMNVPNVAGVMGHCMGLGGVIPLVDSRANTLG